MTRSSTLKRSFKCSQICHFSPLSTHFGCGDDVKSPTVKSRTFYCLQKMLSVVSVTLCGQSVELFRRVHRFGESDYQLSPDCLSVRPSAWNNLAHTGWIFTEFDIGAFFKNRSRKFKCNWNVAITTGTLYEDQFALMTVRRKGA